MAIRIQLRHDSASNWATNNPILYPGEFGVELDTGKIKVGPEVESPAVGTAWNSISTYINLVPADFDAVIDGYLEVTDIGAIGGVAGLNNSLNLIVPGESIIIEGSTDNAFETTLVATDPTADRTITLPDATTTLVGTDVEQTLTNKTLNSPVITTPSITGLYLGDGNLVFEGATADSYETTLAVEEPTADNTLTLPDKTGTIAVTSDITAAVDAITTAVIEENTNLYFTDERAQDAVAAALAAGTHTNITVTYDDDNNNISLAAAPGYVDEQAVDAVAVALANGTHTNITVDYSDSTNAISLTGAVTYTNENARDAAAALITDSTHSGISVAYTDDGSAEGTLVFTNTGVTSLTGTANEVTVSSSTGGVTVGLPDNVTIGNNLVVYGDLNVQGTTTSTFSSTVSTNDNIIYLNAAIDTTITNAVGDGTYVTYTADNTYAPGMDIRVTGMDPATFNIATSDLLTVYSATSTQFVVAKTTTDTFVSGGTAHAKSEVNADLGFSGGYYDGSYAHAGLFRDASDGKFKIFEGYTPEPDEEVNIDTTHESFALATFAASSIEATSATIGDVSNTEIQYLNGVTSGIQAQLDDKSTASKTETLTNKTLTSPKINEDVAVTATATELNILDGATLSTTELNYVDGVTSAIQTQIDDKVSKSGGDTIANPSTTTVPLTIQTVNLNSADFMQFVRSDGFVQARITPNGEYFTPLGIKTGQHISTLNNVTFNAMSLPDGYTTLPTFVIQAAPSQTSALQQWRSSSGTVIASVNSSGQFVGDGSQLTGIDGLPSQTGNDGKYLTTDGTDASWATLDLSSKADLAGATFTGDVSLEDTSLFLGDLLSYQVEVTGANQGQLNGVGALQIKSADTLILNGTVLYFPNNNQASSTLYVPANKQGTLA